MAEMAPEAPVSKERTERVTTVLTKAELAVFDIDRGPLDRSKFLRYLIRRAHKEGIHFNDA